jgi:hypothetical protein
MQHKEQVSLQVRDFKNQVRFSNFSQRHHFFSRDTHVGAMHIALRVVGLQIAQCAVPVLDPGMEGGF